MSLMGIDEVFAVELEDHPVGVHGADDVCIDICNCVTGDFEGEWPAAWISIVIQEFFEVIGYLTVHIRQTHLAS
jgi:hypothetical protein